MKNLKNSVNKNIQNNNLIQGGVVMKSNMITIITSILVGSLLFSAENINKKPNIKTNIYLGGEESISVSTTDLGPKAQIIVGQEIPKGVQPENYKLKTAIKPADDGGYDAEVYINPDYAATDSRAAVSVVIRAGGYGSEMAWNIQDASGATVASGGPYSNCSSTSYDLDLSDGDYTFNAIDTYGDGWNYASGCGNTSSGYEYGSFGVFDSLGSSS